MCQNKRCIPDIWSECSMCLMLPGTRLPDKCSECLREMRHRFNLRLFKESLDSK